MKILCIDQYAELGGGQQSLLDILAAFEGRGWQSSIALPEEGPLPELLSKRGYAVHRLDVSSYESRTKPVREMVRYAREMPRMVLAMSETIRRTEPDLLYVNGPRPLPAAAWLAWRQQMPLLFHCHNRLLQPSAVSLTGQALELASASVAACCEFAAEPLREYVAAERLRIIYNGVSDLVSDAPRSRSEIRRVGVIGRIENGKGQLEFVEAAREIARRDPKAQFRIIGAPLFSGDEYYSRVAAACSGLPIEILPWQGAMRDVYADLDLLVVPSANVEATTRVILEAYSARVPVVAFPAGGIPEILEDGFTGFLSESLSSQSLARRLWSVMQMRPAALRHVVEQARAYWEARFTVQRYGDALAQYVSELVYAEPRRTRRREARCASTSTAGAHSD